MTNFKGPKLPKEIEFPKIEEPIRVDPSVEAPSRPEVNTPEVPAFLSQNNEIYIKPFEENPNLSLKITETYQLDRSIFFLRSWNPFSNPIPEARLLLSKDPKEEDAVVKVYSDLQEALGPQGFLFGGALLLSLLAPALAPPLFALLLVGLVGKKIFRNAKALFLVSSNPLLLPGGPPFGSSTYLKDDAFLKRVKEIRSKEWEKIEGEASKAFLSPPIYLSRRLETYSPFEVEAWLEVMFGDKPDLKLEWIRLSKNIWGIPLVEDMARDTSQTSILRKQAVATLAELEAYRSIPHLKELLKDPILMRAAGGALMYLNESEESLREVLGEIPPNEQKAVSESEVWTESFYEIQKVASLNIEKMRSTFFTYTILLEAAQKDFPLALLLSSVSPEMDFSMIQDQSGASEASSRLNLTFIGTMIDRGLPSEVVLQNAGDILRYAFGKNQEFFLQNAEIVVSYARALAKLGRPDTAIAYLKGMLQEFKNRSKEKKIWDLKNELLLTQALSDLSPGDFPVESVRGLMNHESLMISFKAAELMDRFQPGWDQQIRESPD